jgi:hypothetical protein
MTQTSTTDKAINCFLLALIIPPAFLFLFPFYKQQSQHIPNAL